MSLAPQTRIGPYEVIAKLGQGGMGEVYRARDARLDRDVAIKILPELFASDPERLARFDREAKTLAALSHPNIAAIFGVEARALVMELVEGEDLSAWIARGPMALADALPIARQIADALEAAHESGIVHRDLKPANIKVRPDGTVKVLDFGLAKAMGADASGAADPSTSPTLTARATQMGMIIGTAAYMAPEQARGRAVDRRADIWAFGVVLYEMLSGRRAFQGDDISITLASVLKEDVAWDALPADLPQSLRMLLRRCLEKDPKRRLGWIGEARHTLEDPEAASSLSTGRAAGDSGTQSLPAAVPPKWRSALLGAAALALAVTAAGAAWTLKPDPPSGIVARFDVPFAEGVALTRGGRRTVAISPDGRRIAFIANQQIYLRQMHENEAQPIRGSNVDPVDLAFSPDGEWLAFFVPATPQGSLDNAVLKKIPITGGSPLEVTATDAPYGLRWQGDTLIFSTSSAIMTVAAAGGTPKTLVAVSKGERLAQPQLLNDGRDVLYTLRPAGAGFNAARIVVRPIAGGEPKELVNGGSDGRVLPSGHLVYVRDNNLLAQPFDVDRLEVLGSAVPIVERVRFASASGAGQFDVAANGTLVFSAGSVDVAFRMVWVDRSGREEAIGADAMPYYMPRVSPDGTKVAVTTLASAVGDIWIWNDERKRMTRFTSDPGDETYPVWAADSKSVYYRANPNGNLDIFRRVVEGAGAAEQLTNTPGAETPLSLLRGGTQLLVRAGQVAGDSASTMMTLSVTAPGKAEPLVAPVVSMFGEVSPDGRWLLYQAIESSTEDEVWVRPFPAVDGGRWQVSPAGGTRPTWSRSGREIFYRAREGSSQKLVSVPVLPAAPGAPFAYGAPAPLFDVSRFAFPSVGRTYDVAPGDQRFVFLSSQTADPTEESGLTVIVNWLEDLRARVRR